MADADRVADKSAAPVDDASPPGVPRWVKVSGAALLLLAVLFVVVLITRGGHGPGRHGDGPAGLTAPVLTPVRPWS